MGISVIVSNFNGDKYLVKLLESLYEQKEVQLEIIVVDRQSQDESLTILNEFPGIKIVSEPPQSGLVSGYTRGLDVATQEWLFFCNEDMYFDEQCLYRLQQAIRMDKRICAADPWQWDYQGKVLLHGGTRFTKARWALHSSYPLRNYSFVENLATGDFVPFACAGAFLINRTVFETIGGWDTSFFIDNEDVDLFLRLWQKEWWCVTVPGAKVFHDVGGSSKKMIPVTRMPVSKRRYLSDWASKIIIALKYFTLPAVLLSVINGFLRWINNLRHGRLRYAWWDLLVGIEVGRRWFEVVNYRARHKKENKHAPGEKFFTDKRYQV